MLSSANAFNTLLSISRQVRLPANAKVHINVPIAHTIAI